MVGIFLTEALVYRIRRNVGEGDEEGELKKEDANRGKRERNLAEDAGVWVRCCVLGWWQAGSNKHNGDKAADEADESHDSRRPAIADSVKEIGQH